MPIYEYICPKCEIKREIINPENGVYCECGKKMTKLVSLPAFRVYTKFRDHLINTEREFQEKKLKESGYA